MSAFFSLLRLDATLAVRHRLLHVVVVVAVLFGVVVRFLLPAEAPGAWDHLDPEALVSGLPVQVLDPGSSHPPRNLTVLPVLFAVDLCVLGFMFAGVMVLQDKEFGTLRLFRVSPGTTAGYLGSKLAVNVGLTALNYVVLVGIGAPHLLPVLPAAAIVLLAASGMTLLGIALAVFFRNLSSFFYPLAAVGLLAAVPMYKAEVPAANLEWAWWLPTWHALFGADAAYFGGPPQVVQAGLWYTAAFATVAALAAWLAVDRRLMREVGG